VKALLVVLVVLLGLLVVADRVAVNVAEDRVAKQVQSSGGLAGPPTVDIGGFPFLTQAVAGDYSDVRLQLSPEDLDKPGTSADVRLRGVHVPLSAVLRGAVREVPVDDVTGTATLSYDLVAGQIGNGVTLAPAGDQLRVGRTVTLLGRSVPVTAVGRVRLDGNDLVYDVAQVSGAGVDIPEALLSRAGSVLDFRFPVPALPFGLRLTAVRPTDAGLVVDVQATDTVLHG
jgi:hypothetical protein